MGDGKVMEAKIDIESAVKLLNNIDILVTRCMNSDMDPMEAMLIICDLLDNAKTPKEVKTPMCG